MKITPQLIRDFVSKADDGQLQPLIKSIEYIEYLGDKEDATDYLMDLCDILKLQLSNVQDKQ